ncbi:MAG TPA: hypothetical protein VN696_16615 [Pyrinomonadaceae bacterium]|nr:hypothetical protein [Pyrinomonadaceae bacterium]
MSKSTERTKQWRWAALPTIILFLLALAPQLALRMGHRQSWPRSYFSFNPDEAPYLAYVNALKDGRPRKSDPYSGRDDRPGAPQPETIFSIQFVPAYAIALPSRILGISSQAAFAILSCLVAICAGLALYVLIRMITGDHKTAAAGSLFVLCCGSLRFAPFIQRFSTNGRAQYFPFMRSYAPSFAFPVFILFVVVVWMLIATKDTRKQMLLSAGGAAIFVLLLFSYFYLWTAAIAWLCIYAGLWLVFRREDLRNVLPGVAVIGGVALIGFLGYEKLLAHRAASTDAFQVVTTTHRPDLLRVPELIGIVIAAAIFILARRGLLSLREPRILFVLSLSLLPLVVFNQQALTGYSIQPIHYELYVANYAALLAVVLALSILAQAWRPNRKKRLAWALVAIVSIGWGAIEITYAIRARTDLNEIRDEARPAALRLNAIAKASANDPASTMIFAPNIVQADALPADAPQPVLWAPHMRSFAGVNFAEEKSRYYAQLYFSGTDVAGFDLLLRQTTIAPSVVFGWERVNPRLAAVANPVSEEEIQQELHQYADYIATFDGTRAASMPIAFAVAGPNDNLANLDRWYARDEGEITGGLTLYRVTLRR